MIKISSDMLFKTPDKMTQILFPSVCVSVCGTVKLPMPQHREKAEVHCLGDYPPGSLVLRLSCFGSVTQDKA